MGAGTETRAAAEDTYDQSIAGGAGDGLCGVAEKVLGSGDLMLSRRAIRRVLNRILRRARSGDRLRRMLRAELEQMGFKWEEIRRQADAVLKEWTDRKAVEWHEAVKEWEPQQLDVVRKQVENRISRMALRSVERVLRKQVLRKKIFQNWEADWQSLLRQELWEDIVRAYRRKDLSLSSGMINELAKGVEAGLRWIRTEVRSAASAISRAQVLEGALAAGIRHFRYAGPPPQENSHLACRMFYNHILSYEQIQVLKSQPPYLPFAYYMGGYNCRHWWVPVIEGERRLIAQYPNGGRVEVFYSEAQRFGKGAQDVRAEIHLLLEQAIERAEQLARETGRIPEEVESMEQSLIEQVIRQDALQRAERMQQRLWEKKRMPELEAAKQIARVTGWHIVLREPKAYSPFKHADGWREENGRIKEILEIKRVTKGAKNLKRVIKERIESALEQPGETVVLFVEPEYLAKRAASGEPMDFEAIKTVLWRVVRGGWDRYKKHKNKVVVLVVGNAVEKRTLEGWLQG